MKRLLLAFLIFFALFGVVTLEQWFLMAPSARAQTNTFCAANLACTVTGIWTFSGAPVFGNYSTTGAGTHSGTETFTGLMQCKNFENAVCVDSANSQGWSGTDIGGWINAAYAALPATGGEINVYNLGATCIGFSTPIVFSTSGKYPKLIGHGSTTAGGACLNYTPTTASTAITLDYVPANATQFASQHGFQQIELRNNNCINTIGGCGSSAVGLAWGTTNWGASDATMDKVTISGFNIGYQNLNTHNIPAITWIAPTLASNNIAINNGGNTNNIFLGGFILDNAVGLQATAIGGGEYTFDQTNFAVNSGPLMDFTRNTSTAYVTCVACHFEDFLSGVTASANYITGLANVRLYGGAMMTDQTTGTQNWFINLTGASALEVHGLELLSAGRTFTQAFLLGGTSRGWVELTNVSPGTIPTILGGAGAAGSWLTVVNPGTPLGVTMGGGITSGVSTTPQANTFFSDSFSVQPGTGVTLAPHRIVDTVGTNTWAFGNKDNNGTATDDFTLSGTSSIGFGQNVALRISAATGATKLTSLDSVAITNDKGIQLFNTTTTCTTAASVGATCTTAAISLPVAEADTSYRVVCIAKPAFTAVPVVIGTTNSSATQFTITIAALTAVAASAASYDCTAGHN
jgi:hypothetical protein